MKDFVGLLALGLGFTLIANFCQTPRAEGQMACPRCDCPSYSYTETTFIGGRTVLCNIFVDQCGNLTRVCS